MKQHNSDYFLVVANQWAIPLNSVYLIDSAQQIEICNENVNTKNIEKEDIKQWLKCEHTTDLHITSFRLKENPSIPVVSLNSLATGDLQNHWVIILNYQEKGSIALIFPRQKGSSYGYFSESCAGLSLIEGPSAA